MRAKSVINFQRSQDPYKSMNIGRTNTDEEIYDIIKKLKKAIENLSIINDTWVFLWGDDPFKDENLVYKNKGKFADYKYYGSNKTIDLYRSFTEIKNIFNINKQIVIGIQGDNYSKLEEKIAIIKFGKDLRHIKNIEYKTYKKSKYINIKPKLISNKAFDINAFLNIFNK